MGIFIGDPPVEVKQQPRPRCPECGGRMRLRIPKPSDYWVAFWGCGEFPLCTGTRAINLVTGEPVDKWGEWGSPEAHGLDPVTHQPKPYRWRNRLNKTRVTQRKPLSEDDILDDMEAENEPDRTA